MAFDYRQFLAENKLTKVSKGRETGKAKILSEGIQILEEGEQWIGKFITDTYSNLVQAVQTAQGKCSFNLNGKDFTVRPKGERFLVTSGVGDFGYEAMDIEGACKAAYRYSTGNLKEGFDTEMDDLDECGDFDFDMMEANKQKEDYLKRKEREKKGNWDGSVGAFVKTHGEELGRAAVNRQTLVDYIENVMKPELNDEAKSYVDNLIATAKSSFKLLQSLYNAHLAGVGLKTNAGSLRELATCDEYPVQDEYLSEATNHASLGGERTRKRASRKPGTVGQDRMAKSETKGDEIEITIGGVKKAVSQKALNKYRKMTDPEEKKAWKKKYGFTK